MDRAAYMREWRLRNPESERATKARYWAAHKDGINAARRVRRNRRLTPARPRLAPADLFWSKVNVQVNGCWLWTGAKAGRPGEFYGQTRWAGGHDGAHRVSYRMLVGPIPDGLVIDHLCNVRLCVNPHHLKAVTHRENILRGNGMGARRYRGARGLSA